MIAATRNGNTLEVRVSTKAFTLIELLVSVTIVTILLAVIFPLLSRAKWEGHFAASTNNLRQIYAGTMLYIADTDGYYPHNRNSEGYLLRYDPEVTVRTLPTDSPSPKRLIDSLVTYTGSREVFFFTADPIARQRKMGGFINHEHTSYYYRALPTAYFTNSDHGWPMVTREGDVFGTGILWSDPLAIVDGYSWPKHIALFENGSVKGCPLLTDP